MRFYIYCIQHKDDPKYGRYVGSTRDMKNRMALHRNYACKHHGILYQMIRNSGGWDNWTVKCLEEIETEDKTLRYAREQFWIDNTPDKLNQKNAVANKPAERKRYYDKNREEILAMKKQYYELHKEEKKAYQRERTKVLRAQLRENLAKVNMKPPRRSKNDVEAIKAEVREKIYDNNVKEYYKEDDSEIGEISPTEQEV